MDNTYILISAHFTASTFQASMAQIGELSVRLKADDFVCNPMVGVFVIKPEQAGYWFAWELSDYLRRADVPFVRVEFATPASGYLKEGGLKALAGMGIEFWNKPE